VGEEFLGVVSEERLDVGSHGPKRIPVVEVSAVGSAETVWAGLGEPWKVAMEEAWTSWRAGSVGIGAAVVDGSGEIVSRGRNRILEPPEDPGLLAGTFLAHAEMNALAPIPFGKTTGLTVYTSLEPCLMCAATMIMLKIGRVYYAGPDPLFDGIHEVLGTHSFCEGRLPVREGPLPGPVGMFARLLPLMVTAFWRSSPEVFEIQRRLAPEAVARAEKIMAGGKLETAAAAGAGVVEAMGSVWDRLGD
jgi:tRNA(Arg) A34 adenosine deaminase TadA